MSLFFLLPTAGIQGAFNLTMANGQDLSDTVANGQVASGTLTVLTDGSFTWSGDSSSPSISGLEWWDPVGAAPGLGYHVQVTFTSGDNNYASGAGLGSWLELTTDRSWTFSKAADPGGDPDATDGVFLLEFSDDGGSSTLASASIDDISMIESAA